MTIQELILELQTLQFQVSPDAGVWFMERASGNDDIYLSNKVYIDEDKEIVIEGD